MATQALTNLSIANTPKKETVAETYARGRAVLASDPAGINKPKSVTPVSTRDVSTIITSDQLEGAAGNDIKLPEQPKTQKFETGVTPESVAADQQTELQRMQAESAKQLADVKAGYDNQAGMGEFEGQISEDVGLQAKRVEKTKYDNMILAKQREQDLAIRDAQDATGTRAQKNAIISEITKNTNRELADLSIIQMAKAGEFNDAQAYVNRKVELEFADRKANLDGLKFLYEENKDRLTLVEQRDFDKTIQEEQRTYDEDKAKSTQLENMKLQMQINATEAGAGDAVKMAIQNAEDTTALLAVPGVSEYMKSYEEKLDIQAKVASIKASNALATQRLGGLTSTSTTGKAVQFPTFEEYAKAKGGKAYAMESLTTEQLDRMRKDYESEVETATRAQAVNTISPLAREILVNPKGYFDLTATERGKILKELANAGIDTASIQQGKKRPLAATQVDDLAQARLAKQNVQKIYDLLKELPGTGPISGRLKALNPYDPLMVAINAQITRTVPGLARGIFKEVGVLTDTDVDRYTQTLANPNFTDEQIERMHNDTMGLIDDSINGGMEIYSQLGFDLGTLEMGVTEAPKATDGLSDEDAYAEYLKKQNN